MLYEESIWIGKELIKYFKPGNKILNIGSSTIHMRKIEQPHIQKYIFHPLINNNIHIINVDIQQSDGVDIVGDLTDSNFIKRLKLENYDGILCSNLLEHIEDKTKIINAINELLSDEGVAIITVPYNYPYHLDPIDTMFRPTVKELGNLFPSFQIKKGEIVNARSANKGVFESNYFQKLLNNPKMLFLVFMRALIPFYKFNIWQKNFFGIKRLFKNFSATCIVFIKNK
ncbi:MAG: methyltransferase type 11 [Crocinitomicaceae bacterium]|nr:methyltransferase type 11 [Crocinitomicaceae bacterium]|tara:strand:- start:8128 stop:8811 length:684 start_codon:yes stop_codon:yes gene_type:complete